MTPAAKTRPTTAKKIVAPLGPAEQQHLLQREHPEQRDILGNLEIKFLSLQSVSAISFVITENTLFVFSHKQHNVKNYPVLRFELTNFQ